MVRDSASLATGIYLCVTQGRSTVRQKGNSLGATLCKGQSGPAGGQIPRQTFCRRDPKSQPEVRGGKERAWDEVVKLKYFCCSLYWWFLSSMFSSGWPNFTTNMNFCNEKYNKKTMSRRKGRADIPLERASFIDCLWPLLTDLNLRYHPELGGENKQTIKLLYNPWSCLHGWGW